MIQGREAHRCAVINIITYTHPSTQTMSSDPVKFAPEIIWYTIDPSKAKSTDHVTESLKKNEGVLKFVCSYRCYWMGN